MNRSLLKFFSGLFLSTTFLGAVYAQEETQLLRSPSLSNTHLSFVYGGDIWIADKDGSNPRRLTVNPGVEQNPIFSPDGQQIAFTGNYDGNTDVYVVSIYGGAPKRVTYHPTADVLRGWLNNNEVYFTSTREFTYSLGSRLYRSTLESGLPEALLMPEAYQGSPSSDGRYWAYIKNNDPTERDRVAFKRYRGGGMPSIWIFDTQTKDIEIIPGEKSNDVKPVWLGDKVYFLSDREQIVNVFSYDIKTKKIEKLTNFKDYDVRTLTGQGMELTFEQNGRIHILNTVNKKTNTLSIALKADAMYKRPHYVDMLSQIRGFGISPTGQRALFESRGEIFTVPKEKGDARNISNSPSSHERYPGWSPDGKWISFISDKNGKYELVLRDQEAKTEPIYISLGKTAFYYQPTWSPDSKKLFYNDAHLNLYYVDIDSKKITLVDDDKLSSTTGRTSNHFQPSWSYDSNWIAYVKSLNNGVRTLFMYNLETHKSTQITDGMSAVSQPTFSRDNKYLFFTASTNTGLTNSGLHMTAYEKNVSYNVYAFILSKETPTLFKNESDEEKIVEEKTDSKKEEDIKKNETKKDDKLVANLDYINNRIIALPLPSGYYRLNGATENMLTYQRGRSIGVYDLVKLEDKILVDNANGFEISADGKKMIYSVGRDFFIVNAGQKPAQGNGKLEPKDVKLLVDPAAEWKQVFNEVWAMQKEFFYVENMHGVNWESMKTKYEKFLPYVNHRSDLGYLLNEMMGEMVVGHNYIYPGDQPTSPSVSTGTLGADFKIENGSYRIVKIYSRLDWNPSFKAPLAEPGLNINEGDYILAVDGVKLTGADNIYALLENKVDKQVRLTVNSTESKDGSREIIVRPVSFGKEIELRQMDWVESNRKRTDELSGGKIAYVYMPNTGQEGYISFNRYYFSQMDKKALLLDERNNGGGSVADYVIDLLSRELIAGWKIRDGKSFTTPGNGIYGPKAMIINENAGSGGDMMPYMFRFKGLGKLVGRTTMGILVGISGYPPLLDGGRITSPNFGIFDLNSNYIIENEGVAPDIFIEQLPKDLLEGRDPQLERTINLLLEEMKTYPYKELKDPKDPIRVR
ncbi:PDZ domain-containing protein [Sphingobacterium sp. UT-1RO-CII-1]|uniref:S41 family peptidase n=1 Tax=Sphingobacterium sp. UT-1RO-CII-1 TaxID=2995225 RepID=UPI00227C1E4E|nr:S41 family peptidase [Sphingobacterium sp. UT-1RO-CII-1]MCY4778735.1 PDZ domain-containing protein [Sphingobacterium sp. UT-1RO-CII-1]